MPLLTINHTTQYRYQQRVSLGEHRIMMRPREAFDQRLLSARLIIDPEPSGLRWLHDVFGNSVAIASFDGRVDCLTIRSETTLEHAPLSQTQVDVEPCARLFPFTYLAEDMPDLLRSIERHNLDPSRVLDDWARSFVSDDGRTETIALLTEMATTVKWNFSYVPGYEKGIQTPIETLARRELGSGWVEFDPTNETIGYRGLI